MRSFLTAFLFFISSICAVAQRRVDTMRLSLPSGAALVSGSGYRQLKVIDTRIEKTHFGVVQSEGAGKNYLVQAWPDLQTQFQGWLDTLNGGRAGDGSLLLQLRMFRFVQVKTFGNHEGWCYLRAALYASGEEQHRFLREVDTVVYMRYGGLRTQMYQRVAATLYAFLSGVLRDTPAADAPAYTSSQLMVLDSIEARQWPVYARDTLTDGLYTTFDRFREQLPDNVQFSARVTGKGRLFELTIPGPGGEDIPVRSNDVFAVVYKGKAYLGSDYEFYSVLRAGGRFFVDGYTLESATNFNVAMAAIGHGLKGALVASGGDSEPAHMVVDHRTGRLHVLLEEGSSPSKRTISKVFKGFSN